jgi:nucleoid-associated protein YgaU
MLDGYRYKGRHRTPSTAAQTSARLLAAGVVAVSPFVMAGTAQADTLDAIEQCESGGNPNASNGTHFGLFQFDLATWRSVGGTGDPRDASPAEQRMRAQLLLDRRGTQPWDASKSCWAGKTAAKHAAPETVRASAPAPKPKPAPTAKHRAIEPVAVVRSTTGPGLADRFTPGGTGGYRVKSGDTLSGIAAAHHLPGGWQALAAANKAVVEDAHWIFPGERLAV